MLIPSTPLHHGDVPLPVDAIAQLNARIDEVVAAVAVLDVRVSEFENLIDSLTELANTEEHAFYVSDDSYTLADGSTWRIAAGYQFARTQTVINCRGNALQWRDGDRWNILALRNSGVVETQIVTTQQFSITPALVAPLDTGDALFILLQQYKEETPTELDLSIPALAAITLRIPQL